MFNATKDKKLPTAMVARFPGRRGSPRVCAAAVQGRLGDSLYREQYIDTVACYLNEQERAGLDILTDGGARLTWRLWALLVLLPHRAAQRHCRVRDSSHFLDYADIKPGHILYEVQEAYHPPAVLQILARACAHVLAHRRRVYASCTS